MRRLDKPVADAGSISTYWLFRNLDFWSRSFGLALDVSGLGPLESDHEVIGGATARWRLRDYGAQGGACGPVLIIASPIKQSYIWDITPEASAVRRLSEAFHVYMLDWLPCSAGSVASLQFHCERAIAAASADIRRRHDGRRPLLIGHSLGGVLAAIYCALEPEQVEGLILLSVPLKYHYSSNSFNARFVALAQAAAVSADEVPGSLLSFFSIWAAPETFLLQPWQESTHSVGNGEAYRFQARLWRWFLDEVAVPGPLSREILTKLYIEDRFAADALTIGDRLVGPAKLCQPILAVANPKDAVAPPASIAGLLSKGAGERRMLLTPVETGVGIQHLSILIGARAHAEIWPQIIGWMHERHNAGGAIGGCPGAARAGHSTGAREKSTRERAAGSRGAAVPDRVIMTSLGELRN